EEPVGLGVENAALHVWSHLAELGGDLVHDLAMIDDLVLEPSPRVDEPEQVVAPLGRRFGVTADRQLVEREVIHQNFDVVLLAPTGDVFVVEPCVVGGDEVAPLGDPQSLGWGAATLPIVDRFGLAPSAGIRRARRPYGGADGSGSGEAKELTSVDLVVHR